jgi:hypothetical protein
VPALEDERLWRQDKLLNTIGSRQYFNWTQMRFLDVDSPEAAKQVERFCLNIFNALHQSPLTPEQRQQKEAADEAQHKPAVAEPNVATVNERNNESRTTKFLGAPTGAMSASLSRLATRLDVRSWSYTKIAIVAVALGFIGRQLIDKVDPISVCTEYTCLFSVFYAWTQWGIFLLVMTQLTGKSTPGRLFIGFLAVYFLEVLIGASGDPSYGLVPDTLTLRPVVLVFKAFALWAPGMALCSHRSLPVCKSGEGQGDACGRNSSRRSYRFMGSGSAGRSVATHGARVPW